MKKILILLLLCSPAYSATYYISPSGNDTSGNGSTGSPYRTLTKCYTVDNNGGDTYIFKDGTYNYSGCEINDDAPNGSAGAYTIYKADTDGGAIVTQTDSLSFTSAKSYIQIEGLKFNYASTKAIGSTGSSHIKVLRCALQGGSSGGNNVNVDISECEYILMEDCWVYGTGGRYKILIWRASQIVLRRCVVRDDAGWTSTSDDPEACIAVYESSDTVCENCLIVDSDLSTYDNDNYGAFYLTGHEGNPPSNNVEYIGCMTLNNKVGGWNVDTDDGGVGLKLQDCVAYKGDCGMATSNTSMNMTISSCTFGNFTDRTIGEWGDKTVTVSNSILYSGINDIVGDVSATYTDVYDPNNLSGTGIIHSNPLTNGLSYLPRIEDNSVYISTGNGGQIGARIIKKIGTDGTLYGDTGYKTITENDLWPFPNESRIKSDLAAVSARGFCATGKQLNGTSDITLTSYIWEYLGNQIPQEIYGNVVGEPSKQGKVNTLRVLNLH